MDVYTSCTLSIHSLTGTLEWASYALLSSFLYSDAASASCPSCFIHFNASSYASLSFINPCGSSSGFVTINFFRYASRIAASLRVSSISNILKIVCLFITPATKNNICLLLCLIGFCIFCLVASPFLIFMSFYVFIYSG